MLLVKTKLDVSRLHGIGLFAAQFIPKGTITWEYSPLFDSSFDEQEIVRMAPPARALFLKYAYFDKELQRAARDIYENEELVCDYYCFDDSIFARCGICEADLMQLEVSSL